VLIVDTLVIGGLKFVLRRLAEAVDAQMNDAEVIREELLAAQMRLELGELTPEAFAEVEHELRELRAREQGEDAGAMRITGIDVSVAGEDDEPDGPRTR
jgi:gas vesicle protein GvpG